MKLTLARMLFPLAFATLSAQATPLPPKGATFHFSTEVSRTVEKELIDVVLFSQKSGKNLAELRKQIATILNRVLDEAKKVPGIDVESAFSHHAEYDAKGKVIGWIAKGHLYLTSKNNDAVAHLLAQLDDEIGIERISFHVSPETRRALEDEMTLDIIKQFQHKAELIKQALNATSYRLENVQLNTPNGEIAPQYETRMYMAKTMGEAHNDAMPLEGGKQTLSATATGEVIFE